MGGVDLVPGRHHDEADADGEERADDSGGHAAALAEIVAERRGDEPVGVKATTPVTAAAAAAMSRPTMATNKAPHFLRSNDYAK